MVSSVSFTTAIIVTGLSMLVTYLLTQISAQRAKKATTEALQALQTSLNNAQVENARLSTQNAAFTDLLKQAKEHSAIAQARADEMAREWQAAEKRATELDTRLQEQREYSLQAKKDVEDAKRIMAQEFKALAGDILEQKSKDFRAQHQESLEGTLKPFQLALGEFKQRVESMQKEDLVYRSKLGEELKQLRQLNQQITDDADNLTKALKGEKKLQGNWGEMQLETILESSGLIKGQEYEREANFKDDEGRNKRPDFIVRLPDNKHLIVDSKVSLNAFLEYCSAGNAEQQQAALKRHIAAMKEHIKTLNEKDYPRLTGLDSPDFVFMFVPIEPAFNVAVQSDFGLFEDAFSKHIIIVTPTTLLATLKTVANIWMIERRNKEAEQLAQRARLVYDKLRGFLEKMEKLDNTLGTARSTFDDAMKTLRTGNGNLIQQAEQFKALGVRVKRDIPSEIVAKADLLDVTP